MLRLLQFLYRRRVFILFLLLETVSLWLLVSYNHRYNAHHVNSSNRIAGEITEQINAFNYYFNLQTINQQLAEENLLLRKALARQVVRPDSSVLTDDSAAFELYLAKVVNSSFRKSRNYLTLRINEEDLIQPGMGVVSSKGVVGMIKSVSSKYATVISLLNPNLMISSRVKNNKALSTVQWDGDSPLHAELKYVARHLTLNKGDSVVTSGFDSLFPDGYMIGIVDDLNLRDESAFYDASIRIATDFTNIHRVYIVNVLDREERKAIEQEIKDD